MEHPSPPTEKRHRSRKGCHNCRRLHRKCDETKPSCSACRAAGKQCVYGLRISWGGRPFKKSPFGRCLDQSVAVFAFPSEETAASAASLAPGLSPTCRADVDISRPPFVYGTVPTAHRFPGFAQTETPAYPSYHDISYAASSPSPARSSSCLLVADHVHGDREILQNPSHLSQVSTSHRVLLDHFLHTVTRSFSLHLSTHHGFCTTYLPMALDSSTRLLPAMLEASALHRRSLGLIQDECELISLRHESLRNFMVPTAMGQDNATDDQAVAKALMLCLCEILAGGEKTNSWKLHLQGAVAMLRQASVGGGTTTKQTSAVREFLSRWCESLEVLSLLGPASDFDGQIAGEEEEQESDYIDEFHGFSRGLVDVIKEIHLLRLEQQSLQEVARSQLNVLLSQPLEIVQKLSCVVDERCRMAIRKAKLSLDRRTSAFHPSIQSYISPKIQSDFVAINKAFHHGVLLNIYRGVQDLPHDHLDVESSVEAILTKLGQLELRDEACPGVAMLQPLFEAGCASFRQRQREQVVALMNSLEKRYGMGNVGRARAFIQEYWLEWDRQRDQGADLHWDTFIGK